MTPKASYTYLCHQHYGLISLQEYDLQTHKTQATTLLRRRGNPDAQRHNQGRLANREEISQRIKTHASSFSRQFTIANPRGVQAEITENTVKFLNSWSLHEGMEKLVKHFDKGVVYGSFANQEITNHTIVKCFLTVLKKTGKYQQATKTGWLATTS